MGKLYVGQTAFKLIAVTKVYITNATTLKIKYTKPDNSTDEVTATQVENSTQKIEYEGVAPSILDMEGDWTFWAWVEFSDGRVAPGEPFTKHIYVEGQ